MRVCHLFSLRKLVVQADSFNLFLTDWLIDWLIDLRTIVTVAVQTENVSFEENDIYLVFRLFPENSLTNFQAVDSHLSNASTM